MIKVSTAIARATVKAMLTALIVILYILLLLAAIVAAMAFVVWSFNEHRIANKYRYLIKLHEASRDEEPAAAGWKVTYKEGNKTQTITVQGANESEAMRALLTQKVRYDKIISIER